MPILSALEEDKGDNPSVKLLLLIYESARLEELDIKMAHTFVANKLFDCSWNNVAAMLVSESNFFPKVRHKDQRMLDDCTAACRV